MPNRKWWLLLKPRGLNVKMALMAGCSVLVTAAALLGLAVWQSGQYNSLARGEVDVLINADLDHITQGVYHLVQAENEAVQVQIDYNLNVARHLLDGSGKATLSKETVVWSCINQFTKDIREITLPKFYIGDTWLGKNTNPSVETPIVDQVTRLVGETATIFQRINDEGDMLRVATTVMTDADTRAIGTYIPAVHPDGSEDPVIAAIMRGETYHGRAYVVNTWYLTAYEPIHDSRGRLVGMLYVGIKQANVESRVREAILETRIGRTGYVYVLSGKGEDRGHYIISYKGERDGENIWDNRDSDGNYVIREIIEKATVLKTDEMATVRYLWQNQGEARPRWKIARLAYYAPWDWVIGTSVYEDELQIYNALLDGGRLRMIRVMGLAAVLIAALVVMAGIWVTWSITRPVRHMTRVAEKIIQGDLNQNVRETSVDEIGTLARTFNLMTGKLRSTMEGLKESEEKYRSIFENAIEGMFQSAIAGHMIHVNPAMARILGYSSPEELVTDIHHIQSQVYVNSEDRDDFLKILNEHGEVSGHEVQFRRKDDKIIWVSISARLVLDEDEKPSLIEGFLIDVSGRKFAEEELEESRVYLSEIINTVADPIFVKDKNHCWVMVNNALCAFMGKASEEILGKSDYDYFPKEEADVFWANDEYVLSTGKESINEEAITDAKGVVRTIVTRKTLYKDKKGGEFIVGIIRDVSNVKRAEQEKHRLETRLNQAQKMEAIGTLAGGIAHDFNNILSAIIGFTELAMAELSEGDKTLSDLKQVLKAGNRAKDLVKQILTFSRMTETEYLPISVRSVVKDSLKMLRSIIPTTIDIKSQLSVSGLVMSDPTQIHQIIMNLSTNAAYAMDKTGGTLEFELTEVLLENDESSRGLDLEPGAYVKLRVSDTGTGIDPAHISRIFEPYFTTKEPGRGTGLGLSVIHGIVKSHSGAISCTSELGKGAAFDIYLPKLEVDEVDIEPVRKINLPQGTERILLVDDEETLTTVAAKMLKKLNYRVTTLNNSVKALDLFRIDPMAFDLVITDMTMPALTGDILAREMISIRPDLPVILCTGYNEHISEKKAKTMGIREFILKPLDIMTLAQAIRKAFGES